MTFILALLGSLAGFHPARAAHAAIGTPIADAEMSTLEEGRARVLGDVEADVLVFFRPNQERSLGALRELAQCEQALVGKSVRWVAIVSSSAPADDVKAMMRASGFAAPVLVDEGDALYGSLGLALHPVVVIAGRDHRLAAFEPFRSVDFCAVVGARIRHLLHEISDDELRLVLDPPRAVEGGNGQVALRYRAFAEALFNDQRYDKALENVRKSLDKDPLLAPAHALLGSILLAQGNCAEAVPAFDKALALDAANATAKQGLAQCKAAR